MMVIVDYSWNHTGITFWAWKGLLKNQQNSPYADWYMPTSSYIANALPEADAQEYTSHIDSVFAGIDMESHVHDERYCFA